MSDKQTMSILGLYNYSDGHIFDMLTLPQDADRELLIDSIITEYSDLCVIYPDINTLTITIGLWSNRHIHSWNMLWESLNITYNPIENYDRHEESSDHEDILINNTAQDTGTASTSSNSNTKDSGLTTNKQTSFESNTLAVTDSTDLSNSNSTDTLVGSDSSINHTDTSDHNRDYTHSTHIHGNIGVTTNQQMIEAELRLRKNTFYDIIANEFKDSFLIQIY